ncbi:hypothetical protein A2617_03400 [Candidatus Daviesbacteria bacterium RIFOXYD1_FULL_41_10]|uniref:Glutamate--tRNA ligase n=1 Tax=Candidatus Daviesbacteria bacterium RIFOXYD1_FULL_41_10 TaxID=1797801 RepID=A0A1F5MYW0_9BACT|nr:MAG: hypothetical protein A2617_03400 [Candidatus Daviesbacteria bacterium RIFOXYD1_FULL_41_10]
MEVRVRTAPSPTGIPHIGNTWAALINYLFARKNNGKFILRLEDTDRERLVLEAAEKIFETLHWLGLDYDEGPDVGGPFAPYVQSERLDLYRKYADELLEKGVAFKDEGAIRFRTNKEGKTSWVDLVGNRKIEIENSLQEDFVLLKSDGYPTYNFANVIDDHLMQITHVIRGNEYISSVPKHIQLYEALGWEIPQFAHLPLLLGSDKSKLSKRHGAKSALEFRQDGYLKEALLNFMALLGWRPKGDREIISLDEMVKDFDLKDMNLSSPVFDITKLEWMNGEYIRKMSDEELTKRLQEFLVDLSAGALAKEDHPVRDIAPVVPLIKERIKKLSDFIPLTDFLREKPDYDKEIFAKIKISDKKTVLEKIMQIMENLKKPWEAKEFEAGFRKLAEDEKIKAGDMFQLIRAAISGQLVTPPLFESIKILGEEETLRRIKDSLNYV